jgi:hypothetical protein
MAEFTTDDLRGSAVPEGREFLLWARLRPEPLGGQEGSSQKFPTVYFEQIWRGHSRTLPGLEYAGGD